MNTFERLKELILAGRTVSNQRDLAEADEDGWTIAHVAALHGRLPADFDQWALADETGCTVAHVAAQCNRLPDNFKHWGLKDNAGWTVAHTAAKHGSFKNKQYWDKTILSLQGPNGTTVHDIVLQHTREKIKECKKILES